MANGRDSDRACCQDSHPADAHRIVQMDQLWIDGPNDLSDPASLAMQPWPDAQTKPHCMHQILSRHTALEQGG